MLPFIATALLLIFTTIGADASPQSTDEEPTRRPNILIILTDDQGYGDLSINGNPWISTPHIDSLALDGARFDRFYVNSFCAPTRAALLTGRYPVRCGVWGVTHNREAMRPTEVTLAEKLREAGYRTACVGKWHNGEQYPYTPTGQGFDEFFGFHNGHINNYFDTTLLRGTHPEATQGYITDSLTDEAIRFIQMQSPQPFFCYVAFNAPHSPYQVPGLYYDRLRSKGFDETVSAYWGMCENIDDNTGRLLQALESADVSDNTIVVFLTDNGGTAGVRIYNADMRGGKTSVHEGGCRVPCHIRWPGQIPAGRAVAPIASHIDVLPTLLELTSLEVPADARLDGVSLAPLLRQDVADWADRVLYTHNPNSKTNRYPGAVRTERYRLVRDIRGPRGGSAARDNDASATPWQLYDMLSDPGESRNLATELPEIVQQLSTMYESWIDDTHQEPLQQFSIPVGYEEERPVWLYAPQARIYPPLKFANGPGFAHDWLTGWTDTDCAIAFDIEVVRDGVYQLALQYGCEPANEGSIIRVAIAGQTRLVEVPAGTAAEIPLPHRDQNGAGRYRNRDWSMLPIGQFEMKAGPQRLLLQASSVAAESVMDLKAVRLSW